VRCWIIGDGPERGRLFEFLHRQGWRNEFLMPGTFEDIEPVLSAADLCILPGLSQSLSWLMPTAVVSGLPTLVCDSTAARARLGPAGDELLFERGNAQQLQLKFQQWLAQPLRWQQPLARSAEHLLSNCSAVDGWRRLLARFEKRQPA
jgi:glycosyltransferase involved in cell wall biosynthesis